MTGNSAIVGSLAVLLNLDSAQFESGLKSARGGLQRFSGEVQKFSLAKGLKAGLGEMEGAFQATASRAGLAGVALSAMGVAGLGLAAALGVTAIALAKARDALAFADEIGDSAAKLSMSTDALQEYRFAVQQLGGDFKDADAALEGFTKTFGAAQSGLSAKAVKPFTALGLDVKDFASIEEALDAVIGKIAALSRASEQAAVAEKLGLTPMLPALRAGSGEIERLRREAHALGAVMDRDVVEAAGAANDELEALRHATDVQLQQALANLAPLLLKIAEALNLAARGASDLTGWLDTIKAFGSSNEFAKVAKAIAPGILQGQGMIGLSVGMTGAAGGSPRRKMPIGGGHRGGGGSSSPVQEVRLKNPLDDDAADKAAKEAEKAAKDAAEAARKALQRVLAGEEAVAQAEAAELSARMALTGGIQALADLRIEQVEAERAQTKKRLQNDVAEDRITQAAADAAIALTDRAAEERKALIAREAEEAIARQAIDQRETIAGYYDQISSILMSMAASAAAQNAIEAKALADRQRAETVRLEQEQELERLRGEGTDSARAAVASALADRQAAERQAQARAAQARLDQERNQLAEAELELQIEQLQAQAGAADTLTERSALELRILKLQQQLERLKLEEIVASTTSTEAEKAIARAKLEVLGSIQADEMEAAVGGLLDAFDAAGGGLESMASAFKRHDWGAVLRGLDQTIAALKTAFGPGGTIGGKIGAVAGVANFAGDMIGGTGGAALKGAAGGAMVGFQFGGPVGAAIGGIIGGIGGLFSGSKAKKRAREEAERKKKEEEAARAAEIALQKRAAEIAVMRAAGDEAGALKAEREDELAAARALDPALAELKQKLYDAQDAAEAAARAVAEAAEHRAWEIRYLRAIGDATGAANLERQAELESVSEAQRAYAQMVLDAEDLAERIRQSDKETAEARERVGAAAEREADRLRGLIDEFQGLADGLNALSRRLRLASGTAATSFRSLQAEFDALVQGALAGDRKAFGRLEGVAEELASAVPQNAKTAAEAARLQAKIRLGVEAAALYAQSEVNLAQAQLDSTNALLGAMGAANDNLVSIRDALAGLGSAVMGRAAGGGAARAWGANPTVNAALAAATGYGGDFGTGGFQAFITGADAGTQATARSILEAFGQTDRIQGFATGGVGKVAGIGSVDSQLMRMRMTPGEFAWVSHQDPMATLEGLASTMRLQGGLQEQMLMQLEQHSYELLKLHKRWDVTGQFVRGAEPGDPVATDEAA